MLIFDETGGRGGLAKRSHPGAGAWSTVCSTRLTTARSFTMTPPCRRSSRPSWPPYGPCPPVPGRTRRSPSASPSRNPATRQPAQSSCPPRSWGSRERWCSVVGRCWWIYSTRSWPRAGRGSILLKTPRAARFMGAGQPRQRREEARLQLLLGMAEIRPYNGHVSTVFQRRIQPALEEARTEDPGVFLRGPRQSGKTTLVRALQTGPQVRQYRTLDDLATLSAAKSDPMAFVSVNKGPVTLDEAQRIPERVLAICPAQNTHPPKPSPEKTSASLASSATPPGRPFRLCPSPGTPRRRARELLRSVFSQCPPR